MNKDLIGKGYHILAKPTGPLCNLNCNYCFYLEKDALYKKNNYKMSDEVLEQFIKKYINSQEIPLIQFVWQGGEPTLIGLDFYKKVIKFQQKHSNGKEISNSIQTNGVLLDEQWCIFLKENYFLVGLSLDGTREINDKYRVDKNSNSTFDKVINAIKLLQKYNVPFNVLACITSYSTTKALEIYNFLKELNVEFIQFTPIIERLANETEANEGLVHSSPHQKNENISLTDYSVKSGEYADFLIKVFDQWVKNDVGKVHVMNFEWALEAWLGLPATVCIFAKECGKALAIEHNGDLYSCDHYVYKENLIGNILHDNPKTLLASPFQKAFGQSKSSTLPTKCLNCDVLFACNGECPRHRFNKDGTSYLCNDYKTYFRHIHPYMKVMVQLIENKLPPSKVMEVIKGPLMVYKQ